MTGDIATKLCRLAVMVLVLGAAASCGRKGPLEPPPSATAQAKPEKSDSTPGGLSGLRAKKPIPVLPSKEPSILDPILE